jgi:acyl-CoA thioesterase
MVNGHDICHGGLIFALADSAFAFACNSGNLATVALAGAITFLSPAKRGEELVAEAVETSRGRTTGVTDVAVRAADGRAVATFRGNSFAIGGEVVPGLGQAATRGR